jgi:SHS2 domain-containing protein
MDYEFLDITSDVMFRAYGADERELFENAAKAMFSVICEIGSVQPEKEVAISVTGEGLEELLYEWLSRLLTESEIEEMFFAEFRVKEIYKKDGVFTLGGLALGEDATVEKGATLVKGVTYYEFKIEEKEGKLIATVTLDI